MPSLSKIGPYVQQLNTWKADLNVIIKKKPFSSCDNYCHFPEKKNWLICHF